MAARANAYELRMAAVGIDFRIKTLEIGSKKIKLQIWDTAGNEQFRSITTAYYRGAMGIILVYDVTNERSFESLKITWIKNFEQYASVGAVKMMIGNKVDMEVCTPLTPSRRASPPAAVSSPAAVSPARCSCARPVRALSRQPPTHPRVHTPNQPQHHLLIRSRTPSLLTVTATVTLTGWPSRSTISSQVSSNTPR